MQLAGSLDPLSQAPAGASSSQTSTTIGTAPKPADGAVRDLGVVGRGNKRIKLAPAPLSGEAAISVPFWALWLGFTDAEAVRHFKCFPHMRRF